MTTVRDEARAALAEWDDRPFWVTESMAQERAVSALRGLLEHVVFLEENRLPGLESDAAKLEAALAVPVFPGHAEEALDEILQILKRDAS